MPALRHSASKAFSASLYVAVVRKAAARNKGSIDAIKREMERTPGLTVTLPNLVDDDIINEAYK